MVTVFKSFLRDNLMWLIVYPVICGFSIACFWLFKHFQDELGFTLIHLYGLHPLSIFLISIFFGQEKFIRVLVSKQLSAKAESFYLS